MILGILYLLVSLSHSAENVPQLCNGYECGPGYTCLDEGDGEFCCEETYVVLAPNGVHTCGTRYEHLYEHVIGPCLGDNWCFDGYTCLDDGSAGVCCDNNYIFNSSFGIPTCGSGPSTPDGHSYNHVIGPCMDGRCFDGYTCLDDGADDICCDNNFLVTTSNGVLCGNERTSRHSYEHAHGACMGGWCYGGYTCLDDGPEDICCHNSYLFINSDGALTCGTTYHGESNEYIPKLCNGFECGADYTCVDEGYGEFCCDDTYIVLAPNGVHTCGTRYDHFYENIVGPCLGDYCIDGYTCLEDGSNGVCCDVNYVVNSTFGYPMCGTDRHISEGHSYNHVIGPCMDGRCFDGYTCLDDGSDGICCDNNYVSVSSKGALLCTN